MRRNAVRKKFIFWDEAEVIPSYFRWNLSFSKRFSAKLFDSNRCSNIRKHTSQFITKFCAFFLDKVAPVLEFTDNLPNNSNVNVQKIRWTSSETAKFKCFVDSETNSIPCGSGRRGSWTSPELSDGVHTFKVFGTDENGNVGETIQHTWKIGKMMKLACI